MPNEFTLELVEDLLVYYAEVKRAWPGEHDLPGDDTPIMMFLGHDDEMATPCIVMPTIEDLLPAIVEWLALFSPPSWMALCTDAYTIRIDPSDEPLSEPVNLRELHEAGDRRVHETLIINAGHYDGRTFTIEQRYRYDDNHKLRFEDREVLEHTNGQLLSFVRKVVSLHGMTPNEILMMLMNKTN